MFKLFSKEATNFAQSMSDTIVKPLKNQTVNDIIEEIHESFYTEVDKLLASAKITNSLDTDKQELIDKNIRLKALGFNSTKEVVMAESEVNRLDNLKRENDAKKELIEAISYFTLKYPQYKFITEESVKKICKKYNLVYGEVGKYIGTVPDQNLKHIEDFKVSQDDECYLYEMSYTLSFSSTKVKEEYISYDKYKSHMNSKFSHQAYVREICAKCPLEIAAPVKDFNTQGMEVKEHKLSKIEIPDPVVLKPVIFKDKKYYLIVTAWGLEASDELVLNPNHN